MSSVNLTEGSHASVLQELLLALLGYDGDVFVERRGGRAEKGGKSVAEPWSIGLNVSTEMDWITAPDRCLGPYLPFPLGMGAVQLCLDGAIINIVPS